MTEHAPSPPAAYGETGVRVEESDLEAIAAEIARAGETRIADLEHILERRKAKAAVAELARRGRVIVFNEGTPRKRVCAADGGAVRERRCLSCRRTFRSEHRGNRMCASCAHTAASMRAGLADAV